MAYGLCTVTASFDVLRSDKCISSHGLEPRTPFLDKAFVSAYLSIPAARRFYPGQEKEGEKFLLRKAFDKSGYGPMVGSNLSQLLPDEVLWRRKEAFSDGVNSIGAVTWYQVIEETATKMGMLEKVRGSGITHLIPKTNEQAYYRHVFEMHYKSKGEILPFFWMPKYVITDDPSARTLDFYNIFPQAEEEVEKVAEVEPATLP